MNDTLQRFVMEHAPVRGEVVHLDATWRAVLARCDYPPAVRNLLGEMMAACALLAATLKFKGALVMQMEGDGPIALLVVECTSERTLRATAKWRGEAAPGSVRELLGRGRFAITIAQDERQPYQGIVELEGSTVAEALEHFMQRSEQIDTRLWLAVTGERATGMLLQKLPQPDAGEDEAWNHATQLAATVSRDELLTLDAEMLVRRLYHGEDVRLFKPRPVRFHCTCSAERVGAMLRMLGRKEVDSIVQEHGQVEVHCDFCGRRYVFDAADAGGLFAQGAPSEAPTRH